MSNSGDPNHGPGEGIEVGVPGLNIDDVVAVARDGRRVTPLSEGAIARMMPSARWVEKIIAELAEHGREEATPYYGINTGFGALAGRSALSSPHLMAVLSRNLIASHSVGVGPYFDEEIVRAAMLLRAHSLAQGYSGVRPAIVQTLLDMLNARVYPAIPAKGSLGASGDLAPLSHLALVMSRPPAGPGLDDGRTLDQTSGEAFVEAHPDSGAGTHWHVTAHRGTGEQTLWRRVSGEEAMRAAGIGRIELGAKEGLALNNGATFSAALAALTLHDARNLLDNAELALAMSLEAMRGFRDAFLAPLLRRRGHQGAIETARIVLDYTAGSELLDVGDRDRNPERVPPQDPYSLRCAPAVLGSVRATLDFVGETVATEINAATDNPLIFMEEQEGDGLTPERTYKTVSGGNFHGEPIAFAMDFLGIAVTELGNIAERRVFQMMEYDRFLREKQRGQGQSDYERYRLPPFLIEERPGLDGLNSGFMIAQYTAASLVSDCKALAHPDSVDSIPSSANREDHVSMSLNAARHAREIVDNIEAVIAIEFLCARQAMELQRRAMLRQPAGRRAAFGKGTQAAYELIRRQDGRPVEPYLDQDRVLYPDLRAVIAQVRCGELVRAARAAVGERPPSAASPRRKMSRARDATTDAPAGDALSRTGNRGRRGDGRSHGS